MSDNLLVPLSQLAPELSNVSASQLGKRLANEVLTDDLGRLCVDRRTAARLIGEHQAKRAAATERQRQRVEHQHTEQQRRAAERRAQDEARRARAERQRAILAGDPTMSAMEVMLADDADDGRWTRSGRAFDEVLASERAGHLGVMYRLRPQKG